MMNTGNPGVGWSIVGGVSDMMKSEMSHRLDQKGLPESSVITGTGRPWFRQGGFVFSSCGF